MYMCGLACYFQHPILTQEFATNFSITNWDAVFIGLYSNVINLKKSLEFQLNKITG